MTSNWLLAERARVEPDLVCPSCKSSNVAGRPPMVHLEDRGHCACDYCGKVGPLTAFYKEN